MLVDKPLPAERPTGIGVAAYNMALALSRRKVSVRLVCRGSSNRSSVVNQSLTIDRVKHFSRDNLFVGAGLLGSTDYDVVHVHSSSALPSLALARALGRKVVMHCHADEPLHPIGATMTRNAGMSLSSRVIAVSNSTREDLLRTHRGLSGKVVVAHNGVNPSDFEAPHDCSAVLPKYGLNPADRLILSIGTIQSRKEQLLVVECLPVILANHPGATYVNIGPVGETTYRDQILRRAEALGVSRSVKLLQGVPQVDLACIIQASSVCVHTAKKEAFGLAVVEEMACGRPVVAFGIGGIPEIIDNRVNGIITRPGDLGELSESIIRLLRDSSLAGALGAAAKERVLREFTWDKTAESLERIYAGLR